MFLILTAAVVLIGLGVWGVIKRVGTLKYTNNWRGPRLLIYGGAFLAGSILPTGPFYLLVVGGVIVFFIADFTIGVLVSRSVDWDTRLTFVNEVGVALVEIWRGVLSSLRNAGKVIAPHGWKSGFSIRRDSPVVRTLSDITRNVDLPIAIGLKLMFALWMLLIVAWVGVYVPLSFAWVASGESDSAVLFQRMGEIYLYAYGPYIVSVWLISCAVIALLGSFVRINGDDRRPFRSIVYFSASSGVGAAIGLILGLIAPPLWDIISRTPFQSLLSSSPPASEGLALSCSTLGTVLGALIGTYLSVRDRLSSIGNILYREVIVMGLLMISGFLVGLVDSLSPRHLLEVLASRSSIASHGECLVDNDLKSLTTSDAAKCFLFESDSFVLSSESVFWVMFWILLLAGCSRLIFELAKGSRERLSEV